MSIDLSKEQVVQDNALEWAFELASTRARYRKGLTKEKLERFLRVERERSAIRAIVARLLDYQEKIEIEKRAVSVCVNPKHNHVERMLYFIRARNDLQRRLAKIYLEKKQKFREVMRQAGYVWRRA